MGEPAGTTEFSSFDSNAMTGNPHKTLFEYKEAARTAIDFKRYSRLVGSLLRTEVGLITFLDEAKQYTLAETTTSGVPAIPPVIDRCDSVCQYTIAQTQESFIIEDLTKDERTLNLSCVTAGPMLKTYAGFPITTEHGQNIGAVCALDVQTRQWSTSETIILEDLARMITNDLELHFRTQAVVMQQKMQESIVSFTRANMRSVHDRAQDVIPATRYNEVCETAACTVRETLQVDAVYSLRLRDSVDSAKPAQFIVELTGFSSLTCPAPKDLTGLSREFCLPFQQRAFNSQIYHGSLPDELRALLGDTATAAVITSWPSLDGSATGLLIIKTDSPHRVLRASEAEYLEAFGSTLMSELQKEKIIEADCVKSKFISSLSHELRTPLHGLLHNAEVLMETRLDDEQVALLREIATCGNSQLSIVESMLDLHGAQDKTSRASRIGAIDEVDVIEVVEDAIASAMKRHARRTENIMPQQADNDESMVEIVLDCPLTLHDQYRQHRFTNRKSFGQIIEHLVSNSLKWTPTGFISITVDLNTDAEKVSIVVHDTGKGIDPNFLRNKLYQSFTKEDSFSFGLGLGLSVVADLVHQLLGSIDVGSKKGSYTTVSLSIPMAAVPNMQSAAEMTASHGTVGLPSITSSQSPGEELVLSVLRRDLAHMGFVVKSLEEAARATDTVALFSASRHPGLQDDDNTIDPAFIHICGSPPKHIKQSSRHHYLGPFYGPRSLKTIMTSIQQRGACNEARANYDYCCSPRSSRKREHSPDKTPPLSNHTRAGRFTDAHMRSWKKTSDQLEQPSSSSTTPNGTGSPSTPHTREELDTPRGTPTRVSSRMTYSGLYTNPSRPRSRPDVLVVEDNATNSRLLERFLEKRGLTYNTAINGARAVDDVKRLISGGQRQYDVILMDIQMPVMDGLQATRNIRTLEMSVNATPAFIVACTGLSAEEDKHKAARAGCNTFFTKPISLMTLRTLFDDWSHGKLVQPVDV